jgi:hypothetical protein
MKKNRYETDCKWQDFCLDCDNIQEKDKCCETCKHYRMIDSGYGYCNFNPEPAIVGWCKDICAQFKKG